MTSLHPLLHIITRLSAVSPVLSLWETCALDFIGKNRPSSVYFVCNHSGLNCPINSFYKMLQTPSQTLHDLEMHMLPPFHRQDMVFIVDDNLTSWNEQVVEKYQRGGKNDFKLVMVANRSAFEDDMKSMEDVFAAMWLSGIVRCAVLLVNDTAVELYTYFPFKNSTTCEDTSPVLMEKCSAGAMEVFDLSYKVLNLNRCPIRVALISEGYPSDTMYGQSSPLLQEIGKRLNAGLELMSPLAGGYGGACGPMEQTGLRGMVYNGTAQMAFSEFNQRECVTLEYIGMGLTSCVAWCTPVLSASDFVYSFLLHQLQPPVWVCLIMSLLAVLVSVPLLCKALSERWTGKDLFKLSGAIFAQLQPPQLRAVPARMVVAVWLWACLVLRAAYEGEMKSQSSVQLDSHIIYDLEELSDTNIILCLPVASAQILEAIEDPVIQSIYRKSKVCDGSMYENAVTAARLKDRAVLTSTTTCREVMWNLSKENVILYDQTGGCFKTLQVTPIITMRGSPFQVKLRSILNRCVEAGLIWKWMNKRTFSRDQIKRRPFSVGHLLPALFVLGLGSVGGFLLLVGEKTYNSLYRQPMS